MGHKTPLYDAHLAAGGKMVDFGGWDMPIHYGSQLEEHHLVRREAGMFDVSHMTVVDVEGPQAESFLRYLLANDVARLVPGKALYTAMLNHAGGVIDDLIVYKRDDQRFRLVVNCATREKDLDWMVQHAAGFEVAVIEQPALAIVAVQGPLARARVATVATLAAAEAIDALAVFAFAEVGDWFVARTGYTGEDGVEIMVPAEQVAAVWQALRDVGVAPCGLGARDTLRLEAGMNLYGNDMSDTVSPLEAAMGWTLVFNDGRDFIGRNALEAQREQSHAVLVGLVLEGKGVLRAHQTVVAPTGEGEVTSGTFSPTLGKAIALARLPQGTRGQVQVEIRNKSVPAQVVRVPFVRHGKAVFKAVE